MVSAGLAVADVVTGHSTWLPLIVFAIAPDLAIAFDRSLGFGLRSPEGFQRA